MDTKKYREYQRKYQKKYAQKSTEKERKKEWARKHKNYHKLKSAEFKAKQHGYNFNQILPNIYENTGIKIAWHHINDKDVIAMPYDLHNKYVKNHRDILNAYVEILYGVDLREI